MSIPKNIADLFLDQAVKSPDRKALIERNSSLSYGQLSHELMSFAGYLQKKELKPRDRVLVFVPISIELYIVVLGIIAMGATPVFLDPWSSKKRLAQAARIADCKAVVARTKTKWLLSLFSFFRSISIKLNPTGRENVLKSSAAVDQEDAALITFTTGSSGTPKAAWRSHAFLWHQHRAIMKEIKPVESEVNMTTLPVFVFSNLAAGLITLLPDYNPRKHQRMDPDIILGQLQQANTLICSPDFLMKLLPAVGKFDLGKLREVFTGGASVSPDMAASISRVFPQTTVAYGSTEAEPISSIGIKELAKAQTEKPQGIPVGRLHEDIELRLIEISHEAISPDAKQFEAMQLERGEVGEIIVSGPHVLQRYFRNDDVQKRQKFEVEGRLWHRTGDSGFLDESGLLQLCGPTSQVFREGDKWFCQFPIEIQLSRLASVQEGTLLKHKGEKIMFVVGRPDCPKASIIEDVNSSQIAYDKLILLKELPKDPRHNSKIEYQKLLLGNYSSKLTTTFDVVG